ncbi:ATP-binding protein [Methanolobus mangrovi]|uniref:ATP-binding protein n=1 Tax=Methanolobus mangrovi TaxID=3072977 RepID=A0AA51UEP8_9EURY|nr:ATP-binding protein [Methanolobus mangrovi]WMW21763.1 ATP-binding protein [Methanolobus mangrovi]
MRDEDILSFVKDRNDEKDRTTGEFKSESSVAGDGTDELFEEFEPEITFLLNRQNGVSDDAFGIITTGIDPLEITEDGARITGYITTSHRQKVRLGTYVMVPYGDEDLFARIWKLQYLQEFAVDDATEIHSRRMLQSNTTDEVDYKFLAYLDPICILYEPKDKEGTLSRRMSDRIPRPNTPILPVTEKIKIQTGLNIPEEGIFLGHLSVGGELVRTHAVPPTVPYYLRNDYSMGDPLIFRHMLVCGSTGTGKTFLTKNILRQFMSENNRYNLRGSEEKRNPCLVIMDPQDEYSQIFEDNPDITDDDDFRFSAEKVNFGACKNTKTFVAKVEGEGYTGRSRAEQVEFTIPFEMVRNNSWLIAPVGMTELQYVGVDVLLDDYFKKGGQHTYGGFMDFIGDDATRDYYVESGKIHESSYDGIARRVKNRALARVFDQPARPISEILGQIFKPGQVSVFPTEYITNSRIRDIITLTLMSIIVDNKLNTSGEAAVKETPIILGLDEAHRYLAKAGGEHSRRLISKFADAARQGRKEGLGLFLITQDPQDIDDTIFKQINTRVILNLSNDAAITTIKVKKEFEKRIPYLKKGQMIVQSPDNSDMVEIMGLTRCVVKHV